jgi:hypothetical protein
MVLDTGADWFEAASGILGQLLKYTEQLAGSENDPSVDVQALSKACDRRLAELKKILSKNARTPSPKLGQNGEVPNNNAKLIEMIRELHLQVQNCKEILEKKRTRVGDKIDNLSKTKRAITAYKK